MTRYHPNFAPILSSLLALALFLGGCSQQQKDNSTKISADSAATPAKSSMFAGRTVNVAEMSVAPGEDSLTLTVEAPIGYHFTEDAPTQLIVYSSNPDAIALGENPSQLKATAPAFPFKLPVTCFEGSSTVSLDATIFFCEDGSTVCVFDKVHIELPVTVNEGATGRLAINIDAEGPDDF